MKGLRELCASVEQALHRRDRVDDMALDEKVQKGVCHPIEGERVLFGVHGLRTFFGRSRYASRFAYREAALS